LTQSLLDCGQTVVVLEQDENNELLPECKEQGAIILMGNAMNQELLRRAWRPQSPPSGLGLRDDAPMLK